METGALFKLKIKRLDFVISKNWFEVKESLMTKIFFSIKTFGSNKRANEKISSFCKWFNDQKYWTFDNIPKSNLVTFSIQLRYIINFATGWFGIALFVFIRVLKFIGTIGVCKIICVGANIWGWGVCMYIKVVGCCGGGGGGIGGNGSKGKLGKKLIKINENEKKMENSRLLNKKV